MSRITLVLLLLMSRSVDARPPYKQIIERLTVETDAERSVQRTVIAEGCLACHYNNEKKHPPKPFGQRFLRGLEITAGQPFRFDKSFWAKNEQGEYSREAVDFIRKTIRNMPPEK